MTTVPRASSAFFKGHGLGNDYLVFASGDDWGVNGAAVRRVCERWRGVGADGMVLLVGEAAPPFRLRMYNPDGSEFERSGNGLRVFAACAASRGWVEGGRFGVEVGGDSVEMEIHGRSAAGEYDVSVDMGRASLDPAAAGLESEPLDAGRFVHPELGPLDTTPVSVGNPHCVVFTADVSDGALEALGPFLSKHPAFPRGVNVQLARAASPHAVEIAIWERGVGRTSASGTSSCAVAAAAVSRGMVAAGEVEVRMAGGVFRVTVSPDLDVVLRGSVQEVASGTLAPGLVEELRRPATR